MVVLKNTATDSILLDVNLEGRNGLELAAEIKALYPEFKTTTLSIVDNEHYVSKAIENGACGYLVKIAEKLFNSKHTIETHRQNMLGKTRYKNTASLSKYAVKNGLV